MFHDRPILRLLRVGGPSLVTLALFVGVVFGVVLPTLERSIFEHKRQMIRTLAQSACSVLEQLHRLEREGQCSRSEAQAEARMLIRAMQYGPEAKDYFWINDMQPRMVAHPYRPDLDGRDLSSFTDPQGRRLFVQCVQTVREHGEGYVEYLWQWKDDTTRIVPKISFVKGFEPWGWVVGTGVYTEDVRSEVAAVRNRLLICSGVIFVALSITSLLAVWHGTHTERQRRRTEVDLRQSEARLASIVRAAPTGIALIVDGRFRQVNEHLCRMTGFAAEELLDQSPRMLHTDDDECRECEAALREQVAGSGQATCESRWRRQDDSIIEVLLNCMPVEFDQSRDALTLTALDITARKRAEAEMRVRLDVLTRPEEEGGEYRFEDIFDTRGIQELQNAFAEATGVASIITDTDGRPITAPSNFCRLCNDIIRQTEKGARNCMHSDAMLGRPNPHGPNVQPCLSGGLWDAGASIYVGEQRIGIWLVGQVRNRDLDEERMLGYAREIGADEHEFRAALAEVTVMSTERFRSVARALFLMANQISQLAFQNVQQGRAIHARQHAEAALRASEQRLQTLLNSVQAGIVVIDATSHRILDVNPAAAAMIGAPRETITGHLCHRFICPQDEGDCPLEGNDRSLEASDRVLLTIDGRRLQVMKTVTRMELGGQAVLLESFVDISDRKRAEDELKQRVAEVTEAKRRLEVLVSNIAGREHRMVELKREVNDLLARQGLAPRYEAPARTDALQEQSAAG